jgi:beta-fructofuranosidase
VLKAGWSGILSVPRVLSLGTDGQLHFQPITELEMLRRGHRAFSNLKLIPGANDVLAGVEGDALDIVAEFDPGSAARFGLKVLSSPDREEETSVYYDRPSSRFLMDTTQSSHSSDVDKKILGDSLKWIPGQRFRLRILVDRSVVEAFGDDRAAIAGRVYPKRSGSFGVRLLVEGGEATLRSLDVWQMESIW